MSADDALGSCTTYLGTVPDGEKRGRQASDQVRQLEDRLGKVTMQMGEAQADRIHAERELDRARHQVRGLEERLVSEKRATDRMAHVCDQQAQRGQELENLERQAEQGMALTIGGRVYVQRDAGGPFAGDDRLPRLGLASNEELATELATRHRLGHDHPQYRTVDSDGPTAAAEDGSTPVWPPGPFAGDDATPLTPGAYDSTELLEARSGVFVPVPEGHMLSVTVTPYDAAPDPAPES